MYDSCLFMSMCTRNLYFYVSVPVYVCAHASIYGTKHVVAHHVSMKSRSFLCPIRESSIVNLGVDPSRLWVSRGEFSPDPRKSPRFSTRHFHGKDS